MGNGQSTPKGHHLQRTPGVIQYKDSDSHGSGHYVSARNLAALDALSTSSISDDAHDLPVKKKRERKKTIKHSTPDIRDATLRDMFERESLNFSVDIPEFQKDISTNVDLVETYATVSSPSVPEQIVDVLNADVTNKSADNYSMPSVPVNSGPAETKVDAISCTATVPAMSSANVGSVVVSSATMSSNMLSSATSSVTINNEEPTIASNNASINVEPHWENISTYTPDSGLYYPLIFRRSKKDPGSKEYNEVVKELSSVLERRARNGRPHTMFDDSSVQELEQRMAQSKLEKQGSRSMDSLNSIFANKKLLNKLENHLMNKNRTNQLINEEQSTKSEKQETVNVSLSENAPRNFDDVGTSAGKYSQWTNRNRQELTTSFSQSQSDIYAIPNKNMFASSGNTANVTRGNSVTISGSKVTINGATVTDSNFPVESLAGRNSLSSWSGVADSQNSLVNGRQTKLELTNNTINTSHNFNSNSPESHSSSSLGNIEYNINTSQPVHVNQSSYISSQDTFGYSSSQNTTKSSTSNVTISRYPSRHQDSGHNTRFTGMSDAPSSGSSKAAFDVVGANDTPGRVTTIRLPGLLRNSSLMHSESDLTQEFSSRHQGVRTSDGGFKILMTDQSQSDHNARPQYQKHNSIGNSNDKFNFLISKRSYSFLGRAKSTSDLFRDDLTVNTLDNGQFNPNKTYDHIYLDEDLTRSAYHSDVSSSGLNSPRSLVLKVMDSGSSTSSVDTYFVTADGAAKYGHNTSPTRTTSAAMTTIAEGSGSHRYNHIVDSSSVTASSWSVLSLDQALDGKPRTTSPSDLQGGSSRLYHTTDRQHHPRYHKYSKTHRSLGSKSDSSVASDNSSSSKKSSSGVLVNASATALANKSHMFIVVSPKTSSTLVPDLIVDHRSTNQYKQATKNEQAKTTGSPFHQEISEGTLPTAHGEGLHKGEEDKPATFIIDSRNLRGEPTVQVDGPNAIAKCSIDPQPDGQYRVTYIPVEVGLFDVYVRWNGKEIPGSPFHPKVVDPRKVKVVGGWHHYMDGQDRIHLVVGEEKKIPFDISEAGPGHMRAEVKSPSAFIPVEVDNEHKGKCVVKFVPKEEGLHHIHLYWSDHPLVNSPYVGFAVSGAADPSKVWLSGQGLKEAVIREEAEFIIDGSQAGPGEPEVELTGVRAEIQVFKTPLGGGKYRCTYIPVIPGAYLLNISWNGRQLRGAPYKVNVIGASYPNRVIVNGEGLKGGLMGNSLDFRIDTRKAGPGELTAYCMGPNKVAYCELSDHHDGTYRLVVRPQETGKHVLQIKYGGEHVQGSPYAFKVTAQPDASKVRVSGPGVEHGILATFQSQFIVETKGAGAGQLTVRIRGPKGAFQVEMYRESQKDRTILCRYYPSITGLYIINVRWSGVDVPGSPFHVQILDTQQELEQVLHEQSFSSSGGRHHMVSHSSNSFHNTSLNSSNQLRYSTGPPNGQHHNISRSSGYYHQWREDM
ncbi:filamin-C-like isoform X2 [Biomphalaria pfeifferi]|uniref:Filamin-C-like isoform X2 n=1 Tax=Biomphalaria pfeifferi TaxID=112525 RepID=A0AAD8AS77_BIOPF|nr:filamin-C-like isoform X2 [Biomphalaria pfeifferi]